MKNILLLGAGLVSRPLVRYLLDIPDVRLVVATRTVSKAEELVAGHPRGEARRLLVDNEAELEALVADCDLAISLVPYTYHVAVARHCLKHGRHLMTTSYVSEPMKALDGEARSKGLLFLNECGLDPGIDHMSAMKIIHGVERAGGKVTSFRSCCGGLPAPEANTNPMGYKFSWSPRGVLLAGRNNARWLEDGREVRVPGAELFDHHWPMRVPPLQLEAYPNRDCLGYVELYGLRDARTVFRGTLRNPGWCRTLKKIVDLGWLDDTQRDDLSGLTHGGLTARLAGVEASGDLRAALAHRLGLDNTDEILGRMTWLGLLSSEPLPKAARSPLDVLEAAMLKRMQFAPGERDMIVLHHEFVAEYPQDKGRRAKILSTLIDHGIPGGDSAMARTVSLPAAMATKLILEGKIAETGVKIPVSPGVYEPILAELATVGIAFRDETTTI